MEVFNELCILLVSYILIIFSDYVDSAQPKTQGGFFIIGIVFLNFIVNLLIMAIGMIGKLKILIGKIKTILLNRRLS